MQAAVARSRNKGYYRVLHVPIWIWVFFSLPGRLTADLYAHGPDRRHAIWLGIVMLVCAWRGGRGRLPGTEPRPYITHYGLAWPNLPYRVVCYTAAWIAILAPWILNLIGMVYAVATGRWILSALYGWPYDLLAAIIVAATALDVMPRTKRSIYNEGAERAWFYVGVWTLVLTAAASWAMWRLGPALGLAGTALIDARLLVFLVSSAIFIGLGLRRILPRTARYHVVADAAELQPAPAE